MQHHNVCISLFICFLHSVSQKPIQILIFCELPLPYCWLFEIRISVSGQWGLWQMLQLPVKHRVICSLLMYSRNWSWLSKHELMYLLNRSYLYIVSVCKTHSSLCADNAFSHNRWHWSLSSGCQFVFLSVILSATYMLLPCLFTTYVRDRNFAAKWSTKLPYRNCLCLYTRNVLIACSQF